MIKKANLALYAVIARNPSRVLLAACALLAATLPVLALTMRLDMSFRPLFAHEPEITAATAEYEYRFGQSSGAQIAVLIHRPYPADGAFVRDLARITARVRGIPHVVEVISSANVSVARWDSAGVHVERVATPARLLASSASADTLAFGLASMPSLAGDGGRLLLLFARLDLPLDDLPARRVVIDLIRAEVDAWLESGVRARYSGVSVVEAAYADAIPRGMAASLILTTLTIVVVLFVLFRSLAAVGVCLAGVTVATPLTLALFGMAGRPITMLSSMAPTVVLIVGVADAVHMLSRWRAERAAGWDSGEAARRTVSAMALPCLLTAVTVALGFLALGTARVAAIRQFGMLAATGALTVYAANVVLVPALLLRFGARLMPRRQRARNRFFQWLAVRTTARPGIVLGAALLITAVSALGVPRLTTEQRFNEELPIDHPTRYAQDMLERMFGGFLGPDVEISRVAGGSMLGDDALRRVRALRDSVATLPGVDGVGSVFDVLPAADSTRDTARGLAVLRDDASLHYTVRERVTADGAHLALRVRTGDIGSHTGLALVDSINSIAQRELGGEYQARVVGQWWLAQLGTASLLRDMVTSFATSALFVLPILALSFRSKRLFLIALPPNLLPMLAALAFMGWAGITLRIGTALVLAIALGIAVDDTIHLLARAQEERSAGAGPGRAIRTAVKESGPALVATTLVLMAGFLSMLGSEIAAIRDMGLVAGFTMLVALLSDLLLVPPLYILLQPRLHRLRHRGTAATSYAGSNGRLVTGTLEVRLPQVVAEATSQGGVS